MTDHAVLVPTTEGPVGGIVSEPSQEARGGLVLLPGYGGPARSGINSLWTRIARRIASDVGVTVLRIDYSREGETLPIGEGVSGQAAKSDLDRLLLDQTLCWFRERLHAPELFFAGACAGGRLAIELAGADPGAAAGSFAIVPSLRPPQGGERGHETGDRRGTGVIDPVVVDLLEESQGQWRSWILVGEHDEPDVDLLPPLLGPDVELVVDRVPGKAIHFLDQLDLQEEAERWLVSRVAAALAA